MQLLEVSGAVRPLYGSLGVKGLIELLSLINFIFLIVHKFLVLFVYSKTSHYKIIQRDSKRRIQFRTSIFHELYRVCE